MGRLIVWVDIEEVDLIFELQYFAVWTDCKAPKTWQFVDNCLCGTGLLIFSKDLELLKYDRKSRLIYTRILENIGDWTVAYELPDW